MSISQMTLPTDKNRKPVIGITVRQGDKKGKMDVYLLDANNSPYNLTDKTLVFIEQKSNNKWIVDSKDTNFNIVDKVRGHFTYQLNDAVDAIGTGRAWFEIQSSDGTKDSSQTFSIDVEQGLSMAITNSNYISEFEDLRAKLNDIIKNAQDTLSKENTDFLNQTKSIIASLQTTFSNLEKSFQSSFNSQTASINSAWTSDKARIDKEWSDDKSRIDSEWTTQKSSIQSYADKQHTDINNAWSTQTNKIASEWSSQHSTIQSTADKQHTDIDNAWDAQTKSIDSQWAQKKASLDSMISQLSSQLTSIQTSVTDLSNNKLPAMDKYADTVQAKVDKLRADFNAVDWSSFATKSETAVAILNPFPTSVTDMDNLPEGRYNTRNLTEAQWQAIKHIPPIDKYGMIICYREEADGWQMAYSTNKPGTIFFRGAGGAKYVDWQEISQPSTTYTNTDIDQKIAANTPSGTIVTGYDVASKIPTKATYRYSDKLLVDNNVIDSIAEFVRYLKPDNDAPVLQDGYDLNNWFVGWRRAPNKALLNAPGGFTTDTMYLGLNSDNGDGLMQIAINIGASSTDVSRIAFRSYAWARWGKWAFVATKDDVANLQNSVSALNNKVNLKGDLYRKAFNSNTWNDILGDSQQGSYLTAIRDESGSGFMMGDCSAGVVFGGEDTKGVLNVHYNWHNARIIGGNGDTPVWSEDIAWKSDINNVQNQINEIKNIMPDIHTVSSEAEGNTYLASHPNAIIFVKG